MPVTQNGGHMNHVTTTSDRSMKSGTALKTGSPGGALARSSEEHLVAAFPASPLWNGKTYDATQVSQFKYKLLTNTVIGNDTSDCAAYWGFSTPVAEADSVPNASATDLSYAGAPDLDGNPGPDNAGHNVASNFMPNLRVPDIDTPTDNIADAVVGTASTPFGVGNGLANPKPASAAIKTHIVESQKDGNVPIPGGPTPTAPAGGDAVRTPTGTE